MMWCLQCNIKFKNKYTKTQKFCSLGCYHESLKTLEIYKNKTCKFCGKGFVSTQKSKLQIRLNSYCSRKCRQQHQSNIQKTGEYKKCVVCCNEFYIKKCQSKQKCCSKFCAYKYMSGRYYPNRSISRSKLIADGKINPKRNFYKHGWYIRKNGNKEWFGSSYEEIRMRQLDLMNIKWTKNHGIRIPYKDSNGNTRNYVPDFLVNDTILEEVKPKTLINSTFNNANIKLLYAIKYCFEYGYSYRIITEKDLITTKK